MFLRRSDAMTSRQFANRMNKASKNILRPLIPALGLHKRAETILYKRYIEEDCIYDLAEFLGVSYDTLNNYLCDARQEMLSTMENDFDILPPEIQVLVKKLIDN